jgi:hypothetical protein
MDQTDQQLLLGQNASCPFFDLISDFIPIEGYFVPSSPP